MVVNYNDLKDRILDNSVSIERLDDQEKIGNIMVPIIGKDKYLKNRVNNLEVMEADDLLIYKFESVNTETNKQLDNILICRNNLPLVSLEHNSKELKDVSYVEDSYIIYHHNTSRIKSKINISSLKSDDIENTNVLILDSDSFDPSSYYQKKYRFMIKDDEVLSLMTDGNMFLSGEALFSLRRDNALECIGKILDKINTRIDSLFDDDVKKYQISRKRQG